MNTDELLQEFVALGMKRASSQEALAALDEALQAGRIHEDNVDHFIRSIKNLETNVLLMSPRRAASHCRRCHQDYQDSENSKKACRVEHEFSSSDAQREDRSTFFRCKTCGTIGKQDDGEGFILWSRKLCYSGAHSDKMECAR